MTIAILAHDSRKELALQFCTAYSGILSRNTVIATGTTGRMLAQATGLPVHCYLSGKLGGIQQISSRVACDEVDLVLFFRDPLKADSGNSSEQNLLRLCDLLLPRCCCAAWTRATWTTATGCTRKFWSPFPSTVPCAEKLRLWPFDLFVYRGYKNSAAERTKTLRRCFFYYGAHGGNGLPRALDFVWFSPYFSRPAICLMAFMAKVRVRPMATPAIRQG